MDDIANGLTNEKKVVSTVCASHCGGSCLLKVHVKDGVITRIETDDGEEPQLRACWRGRAYRQRVYAKDRVFYPMKRVGERGEGKFERISWDEALETVARQLKRVRDTYGPEAVVLQMVTGDAHFLHQRGPLIKTLSLSGGFTPVWGITSFHQGLSASLCNYGTIHTYSNRDDLLNSRLIIMWGWDPAKTIAGTNTSWYLAQAREAGCRIISVDPQYTNSAATFAEQWIPIHPGTDCAMLLAMAYVMIKENIYDKKFIDTYTTGFDKFKEYVIGKEDGIPKTPSWAEEITGVPAYSIEKLAKLYATIKPAALMAGISPGRTAYGEQYHRAAITLAAMAGNVGIHGGDAAGRAWESVFPGYPYKMGFIEATFAGPGFVPNPAEKPAHEEVAAYFLKKMPFLASGIHCSKLADAILKGKAGGYPVDYKMIYIAYSNYVTQWPDVNKVVKALKALEFIAVQEQFMTPTAKFADILLPVNTYMERNDFTVGVGEAFIGRVNKVIEPLGESKSGLQIAIDLAKYLGIDKLVEKDEQEMVDEYAQGNMVPDLDKFKKEAIYKLKLPEPYVVFKDQIKDPANNPFPTPSGKIEIYSQELAEMNIPGFPPIPKYIETWESRNDPLTKKYPLQMITTHFKRRALSQNDSIPWLRELEYQPVIISSHDARIRNIEDGEMVRVFNDRGEIIIRAKVTERIIPGVVDIPHGAWYNPDKNGVDRGGSANILTSDEYSPTGGFVYNTALVEVEKISEQTA